MSIMTLREVCTEAGVSRRAVQGYEKAGLVLAAGKNERGYLLYDEKNLEKIKRIKLFQNMGFSVQAIRELDSAPNSVLKTALEIRVEALKKEGGRINQIIIVAEDMIRQL